MNTAPEATPKYRTRSGRISEEIIDAATRIHCRTRHGDRRRRWDGGHEIHAGGSILLGNSTFDSTSRQPAMPCQRSIYQAIFEANLKDVAEGGQGTDPTTWCLSPGMPRLTNGYGEIEFVITPETFHILVFRVLDSRRIFTDGRDFPTDVDPSFLGISIGRWIDTKGDGHYDVLEVETRNMKGPRAFDASGLPLHADNQTIVKERYTFDLSDPDVISNEVTVIDHALTHPWTVTKHYQRSPNAHPWWVEDNCMENNNHIRIQGEPYFLSADGLIMPAKKGQRPPDLRYFNRQR
jgi:hypothetical protein